MRKFKIGDRVRFYCVSNLLDPVVGKGTIAQIFNDGLISVDRDDKNKDNVFHPKQLSQIIKKKKTKTVWQWRYYYTPEKCWIIESKLFTTEEAKKAFGSLKFQIHAGPFEVPIV